MSPPVAENTAALDASATEELRGLPARFRPEKLLGRGSQRSVYLAHDHGADRWVAVSVFDTRALSPSEVERLQQVHAVAGSGAHPHVLPIEPVGDLDGTLFHVSPFLAGGDLATRLQKREKSSPLVEILRVGSQLCRALESIHAAGICHRDIKPGNILLDERGDAYLCDFGLAVDSEGDAYAVPAGTPAYIAPEQIANPPGGAGADLYSLGCVLYELATGSPPFVGEPASEILLQHQATRPVPPIERNRGLPRILSELILRLLEKQPKSRPGSAADVRAALEGMLSSPETAASDDLVLDARGSLLELPLVGREREIESFDDALARTSDSMPGVALLTGDAGSGKSRLFAELRAQSEASGCVLLNGTGELRSSSYRPFADALLPLAGHLSELDPIHADLLRNFLYRGHDTDRFDHLAQRGAERYRLFSAVLEILSLVANTNPVVLLLEDLHAFDNSSLDLFEDLASALLESSERRDLGLLVVASTRPPGEGRLVSLLGSLRSHAACRSIELAPLDEPAIYDLLTALGGNRRPSGRLCHKVVEATDGNPLFVREVIHRFRDSGVLERDHESGAEPWDVEFDLPSSVAGAIAERIEGLSTSCRDLLALGALLGTRFEPSRLAAVSQCDEALFTEALTEAIDRGMLVHDGVAYRFAHPLILQAVRDAIGTAEKESLHFRIASRLLQLSTDEVEAALVEIAHHLIRSGRLADPIDVARIAGRAGHQAFARFAWHDATDLLEAAIAASNRGARLDPLEEAELHRSAGLAYFRLMDENRCLRHYDAAIAGFEASGDQPGLTRALNDRVRLSSLLGFAHGEMDHRERLERAIVRLAPAHTALRAQILNTLAESYWGAGDIDRAEQLGVETLALANRVADQRLCADACIDLGMARFIGLRVEEALSTWQAGAAHARRAGDLLTEERCVVRSGLALIGTGRLDEALQAARTVQEMHRVLQFQSEMSLASCLLVAVAAIRGDGDVAERHAADALARIRRVGYRWGTVTCVPALACSRALANDVAGALGAIQLAYEPEIGLAGHPTFDAWARCLTWVVHWYAGDTTGIHHREVEALQSALEGKPNLNGLIVACAMIELADALQSPAIAEQASGVLGTAHRQGFVFCSSWPFFLPRLRGVAAMLAGRFEFAEEQLDAAIAIAERVGATIELERSRLDLARMLATRNLHDDRVRARRLIDACRSGLALRGPAVFAERANRLDAFLQG